MWIPFWTNIPLYFYPFTFLKSPKITFLAAGSHSPVAEFRRARIVVPEAVLPSRSERRSRTTISYSPGVPSMAAFGAFEIWIQRFKDERKMHICSTCSIWLHALTILVFAVSQEPYVTVLLFMLFMVKVVLLIKKSSMK